MKKNEINTIFNLTWPVFFETVANMIFVDFNNSDVNYLKGLIPKSDFMDATAMESFNNHIHLEDYIKLKDIKELFLIGEKIAEIWILKLKNEYKEYKFRLYLTLDDNKSVTIRFHKIRDNEPYWLYEEDWKEEINKDRIKIFEI